VASRPGLPRLAILLACALVWTPVLGNPGFYNHDELELLHGLRGVGLWQLPADLPGHFATTGDLFYRPLGFFAFRVQFALAGGVPWLVHLLSFLHHLGNAALFGLLLRRCGRPATCAWLLLLLPAAVPAVAWAAAIYERLLLTLSLAALLLLLAHRRGLAWLAFPVFVLALCTKETAIVLAPVALLLVWHRQPRARVPAALMLMAGVAFAIWRVAAATVHANPDYRGHPAAEAALGLLRMAAFPCAVTAGEPGQVWGWHWLPGLLGMALLAVLAFARGRRSALAAIALFLLPLLPVALWSTPQGHYLYLAAPGLALAVALALGRHPRWSSLLLLLLLLAHSVVIALYYRSVGTAMTNLERAWRSLPATAEPVTVVVPPDAHGHVVLRFSRYLEHTGQRPLLRQATDAASPGGLALHADGTVTLTR
jgi:hypothetical protein